MEYNHETTQQVHNYFYFMLFSNYLQVIKKYSFRHSLLIFESRNVCSKWWQPSPSWPDMTVIKMYHHVLVGNVHLRNGQLGNGQLLPPTWETARCTTSSWDDTLAINNFFSLISSCWTGLLRNKFSKLCILGH